MTGYSAQPRHLSDIWNRRLNDLTPLGEAAEQVLQRLVNQTRQIQPRDHILRDGASEPLLRVLLSGFACRYKYLPDGRRQITAFLVPGDLCDFGFLSDTPVSQGVIALAPSLIGVVEMEKLSHAAEAHPAIMIALLKASAIEHNVSHELVASLGGRNALHRVGHFLCEMHFRLHSVGVVRANGQFDLPITQSEMGEALGLSTVHVNRTLQMLRKNGLAEIRDRVVTIENPAALAELCAFDEGYLQARSS